MNKKELKIKNENLFLRNTMLLNENQKLRDKITTLLSGHGCETCTKFDEVKLTKAKELLKRCYENYIYLEPLRSEIEQFLKEIEK